MRKCVVLQEQQQQHQQQQQQQQQEEEEQQEEQEEQEEQQEQEEQEEQAQKCDKNATKEYVVRWLQAEIWKEHHAVLCTCAHAQSTCTTPTLTLLYVTLMASPVCEALQYSPS